VASGFRDPLDLQTAPGDRDRLYVVEQGGRIRTVRGGEVQAPPFLDVSDLISSGGERGSSASPSTRSSPSTAASS
jgi:hypothetical protein